MILAELLKAIQPQQVIGGTDIEIKEVNIDSRKIEQGHLFMAMCGTQTDGHTYIPGAIEKGAVAVLCEDVFRGLDLIGIGPGFRFGTGALRRHAGRLVRTGKQPAETFAPFALLFQCDPSFLTGHCIVSANYNAETN